MPFDGIVLSAVAAQLKSALTGGKIDKIYQPEPDELLLHINVRKEKYKLYISSGSAHPRINLVPEYSSNHQSPMGFCMLLRKHIQGGRITRIDQKGSERILEISVDTVNELGFSQNKKLIVEIMGKHSNIILIDSNSGVIIDSIKRLTLDMNRHRQTMPGNAYIEPPSQGKSSWYDITAEEVKDIAKTALGYMSYDGGGAAAASASVAFASAASDSERANADKELVDHRDIQALLQDAAGRNELAKYLAKGFADRIQGFSKQAAEELAERALVKAKDNGLGLEQAAWDVISELVAAIKAGEFSPRVYFDGEKQPIDFHAFPFASLENACLVSPFDDISDAIEYYYSNKAATNRIKQKTSDLSKAVAAGLDKLYLKKQRLSEDLIKAENAETDRLYGELIIANLHNIEKGLTSVTLDNYYDGSLITISLDNRLTPSQNAQRYYKLYSKAKTAVVEKKARLIETERDIAYLKSVLTFIENATSVEDADALRLELMDSGFMRKRKAPAAKKSVKSTPLSYELTGGFKVMAGKNNNDNDLLTFKKASGKDIWLHTKDIPGSHVILFTNGAEIPEKTIFEAAAVAAWHSGARASGNVPVDYTLVKHVKKPSGAKPGMVIFTHNRTVYVDPALPD